MERANGMRYLLAGGTRERHFDGTHFEPRKLLENAPTPTSVAVAPWRHRVHVIDPALRGCVGRGLEDSIAAAVTPAVVTNVF